MPKPVKKPAVRAKHKSKSKTKHKSKSGPPVPHTVQVPAESFLAAKVRTEAAIVRRLERQLAQRSENLLPRANTVAFWRMSATMAGEYTKRLVDRLPPLVAAETNGVEVGLILDAEVRRTLDEIQVGFDQLIEACRS